jgi:cytochrome c biogenesis protein ResB
MASDARPAVQRHTPGPLELLWRALNSLPVATVVILALALLSAVGTLIPQTHLDQPPAGLTFEQMLDNRYGAQKAQLITALGLHRIYFTWYFNALLIWLAVSAVICNIVRYRRTLQMWQRPTVRRGPRFFMADRRSRLYAAEPGEREIFAPALAGVAPAQAMDALEADLRKRGYRVRRDDTDGVPTLYGDKGFLQKWALVLLHFAVLVLLFGGMYGKAVGVEGSVRLADGERRDLVLNIAEGKYEWVQPWLKRLPPLTYDIHQHTFRIDWKQKILLEEALKRNVDPPLQEYYHYFVDDYVSDLEVSQGGVTKRDEVRVNHPLIVTKLNLYQSAYEQVGYLSVTRGAETETHRLPQQLFGRDTWMALTPRGVVVFDPPSGRWFVPEEQGEFLVKNFVDSATPVSNLSFQLGEAVKAGDLYRHDEKVGRIGPLTIMTIRETASQRELGSLIVDLTRGFDLSVGGQVASVRLADKVDNFSIFQYKRDPGIPILYAGWIALILGVALTMYIPFTQVWARAEPGRLRVLALGPDGRRGGRLRARLNAMLGVEAS